MKPEERQSLLDAYGFFYGPRKAENRELFLRAMESEEFLTIGIAGIEKVLRPTEEEIGAIMAGVKTAVKKVEDERKDINAPRTGISDLIKIFVPAIAGAGLGFLAGRLTKKKDMKGAST